MKVTSVIRNYVEREVDKKFEPLFKEAEAIDNPAVKEVHDAIRAAADELNQRMIELAQERGVFHPHAFNRIGIKLVGYNPHGLNSCIYDDATEEERMSRLAEIRKKKRNAVEDILVAVELGDLTKRELCDLIEAIEV